MALFRSVKYPAIADVRVSDEWTLSRGTYSAKPLILRLRTAAKPLAGHPAYRHQVGVAVPLLDPDANGFPNAAESEALGRMEDMICRSMEQDNESILVAVISTNGMREFVLYTSSPAGVEARFESISAQTTTHQIQFMIQPDEQWRVFKSLSR